MIYPQTVGMRWEEDELGSRGYWGTHHVVTIALGPNEEPDGVPMIREAAAEDRWRWSTWGERNKRLASGVAASREDAKIDSMRIGFRRR